ncbi:gmp synthase [Pyrenophora seminiperda CCB06]|uniref:Gmp synthase n=1 Tax=Pyrenophora seminiperda CCB06 TaxID=1302712 RepID=A0A3M7M8X8_9PLEO|nr:gmp synthase [Pyrenophora seminiperda CCB06]
MVAWLMISSARTRPLSTATFTHAGPHNLFVNMDKFKSVAKGGWHPEKSRANSGSSTGAQSESKLGQVKGWVGKAQGKDVHAEAAREHQSAPLSSLKDPASFAPPPKRVNYNAVPAASGVRPGAVSSARVEQQDEAEESRPVPGPYRRDTTGLSTAHLPKPPAFRPDTASPTRPKPSLPPRLPPRQNSNPHEFSAAPPPTYNEATQQETASHGTLNQAALGRLGQAGVSVPGFGIGRTASPPVPPRANPSPPVPPRANSSADTSAPPLPVASGHGSHMNELQNRFAKLAGPKSPAPSPTPSPAPVLPSPPSTTTGTSWADKQAALRTASNLRDDPSKVSAADLKGAASTANNFQQRHGDQVASGWKSANTLNQKYGIMGKMSSLGSSSGPAASPPPVQSPTQMQDSPGGIGKKAPPPPPPPKKKELSNGPGQAPPIPLSSKPKF